MQLDALLLNTGLFAAGLVMLVYSSDVFVEYASRLAKQIGISELTIGLTIVAIGTSMPEIVSSVLSILADKPALAFGNIIGSFLINLTLIIGVSALLSPLASNAVVLERDSKIMILTVLVLVAALLDPFSPGAVTFWEGLILIVLFFAYLSFLYSHREEALTSFQFSMFVDYLIRLRFLTSLRGTFQKPLRPRHRSKAKIQEETGSQSQIARNGAIVMISLVTIVLGAQVLITSIDYIAMTSGISEGLIGVTLVAIGTSLPELMVSINSAKRGFGRLLIGNVIGSNIVNITLGLGIGALLLPVGIGLVQGLFMAQFAAIVAIIFHYIIRRDWRVTRNEGIFLLFLFVFAQLVLSFITQFITG